MNPIKLVSQAREILERSGVEVTLETLPYAVAQLAIQTLSCPGFERARPNKPMIESKQRPEPIE